MQQFDYAIFAKTVFSIVAEIPKGKVTSYGHIAVLAGKPNGARLVGRVLKNNTANVPCYRVVNSKGRLVPGWQQQKKLLENEGISFSENGNVNIKLHRWK